MKKVAVLALLATVVGMVSLVACGGEKPEVKDPSTTTTTAAPTTEETTTTTTTTETPAEGQQGQPAPAST